MKTKLHHQTAPWRKVPKRVGYRAHIEGEVIFLVARNKWVLRSLHKRLFPDFKFNAKLCHPAQIRRIGT